MTENQELEKREKELMETLDLLTQENNMLKDLTNLKEEAYFRQQLLISLEKINNSLQKWKKD